MEELGKLRGEVLKIDGKIVNLIKDRIEITKKIGRLKKDEGIPLRDWEVEKTIIENAGGIASEIGLSPRFIKSVLQLLIKESRIQQELFHYSAYRGDKENILIVGGLGQMGKWFSYFFQNQGHNVSIFDIKGKSKEFKSYSNLDAAITDTSFILIALPLEHISSMIDDLLKLDFKGVVFDIASLKSHLKDAIQRAYDQDISITSIHPMFGPTTRTLSDKIICFCDCGDHEANQKVESFFNDTSVSKVKLSIDEHDHIISYVLGLSHLINIIYLKVLADSKFGYQELNQIGSTTFISQMMTTSTVFSDNPGLYYKIQEYNPFKKKLYEQLEGAMKSITDAVLSKNEHAFIEIMQKGEEWIK